MPFPEPLHQTDSSTPARPRRGTHATGPPATITRRGVTLVELLVVVAVGAVVAGLLLGILIRSDRETHLDMRRAAQLTAASSAIQTLSLWCERARSLPSTEDELFELNEMRLVSRGPDTAEPGLFVVRARRQEANRAIDTEYRWTPVGATPTDAEGWVSMAGGGKVWLSVSFRYAWEFNGLEPKWLQGEARTGRPRAVEIIALAQDAQARVPGLRLQTVVSLYNPTLPPTQLTPQEE